MIRRRRTAEPSAVIVLRASPDWGRLKHLGGANTDGLDRALRRPSGFTRDAIELWDATFRLSFFEVRQALKDLTLRSFAAVKGAAVVPVEQVRRWPPADVVLFSDDDDWYAPDVVEHLRPLHGSADGVTWTSIYFTGAYGRREPGFCYTNNYAVMAGAPLPGPWPERALPHGKAAVSFRRPGFRAAEVPLPLSVSNKHPASAQMLSMALGEGAGRDGLVHALEAYTARAVEAGPPAGDLAWARDLVAETTGLFASLRPR